MGLRGKRKCRERCTEKERELQIFAEGSLQVGIYVSEPPRGRMKNHWKAVGQIILRIHPELRLICISTSQDGEPSLHTEY